MAPKRSICIISLSPIARDARVLRHIAYLSPFYHLTVIGFGPPPSEWNDAPDITWVKVTRPSAPNPPAPPTLPLPARESGDGGSEVEGKQQVRPWLPPWLFVAVKSLIRHAAVMFRRLQTLARDGKFLFKHAVVGRMLPTIYDQWYWHTYGYVKPYLSSVRCDAFLANDWETLPLVAEAAKQHFAYIVCDLHEYAPLRVEENRRWMLTVSPLITAVLKRYRPLLSASLTVGDLLAERYQREFRLTPIVVHNAPAYEHVPEHTVQPTTLRLIHHGIAQRARNLELMIETLALCDARYTLHVMLIPHDPGYLETLQHFAEQRAPGRVFFHEPVKPTDIVRTIASYDIGFCVLKPTNFNTFAALPNKFFDCLCAGLAVCIGPSPAMARIVEQYRVGWIAPSFQARDIARLLNQLTTEEVETARRAAREAAAVFNAEREMGKVLALYQQLFARDGGR